jgi:hypothetical protein
VRLELSTDLQFLPLTCQLENAGAEAVFVGDPLCIARMPQQSSLILTPALSRKALKLL